MDGTMDNGLMYQYFMLKSWDFVQHNHVSINLKWAALFTL